MKLFKYISLFFVLATVLISCDNEDPDTVGPAIEIINIPDNKEFKFGENLVMHFKITDQTGFYEYKYELYKKIIQIKSFDYEKHITFEGYFTEKTECNLCFVT